MVSCHVVSELSDSSDHQFLPRMVVLVLQLSSVSERSPAPNFVDAETHRTDIRDSIAHSVIR